jgi:hypothetical protein
MFYEADHSADELDTIDRESKFMNLSMILNMMNNQIRMDRPKDLGDTMLQEQDLTTNNNMNITIGKQLMQVSMIQQEPEEQFNIVKQQSTHRNLMLPRLRVVLILCVKNFFFYTSILAHHFHTQFVQETSLNWGTNFYAPTLGCLI